jgi:2-polyprenyl-3-methyl-5-hydroxy-6-metoxy-1,4-benzoquinol methylase
MTADESNRWLRERSIDPDAYDATYERRAAAGENVHGEADFVQRFAPASVLDAGCGTGRVGRELARRGLDVAGVDIDAVGRQLEEAHQILVNALESVEKG